MTTSTLLLYHALRPLEDATTVRLWQHELCRRLGLHGRVVVSPQGIFGAVGGSLRQLREYADLTRQHPALAAMSFRATPGEPSRGPQLDVVLREEVVAFGAADELRFGECGLVGSAEPVTPRQVHELLASRGDEVVLFDGRNRYEAEIGRFRGAVVPDANAARELLAELDSGRFDHLKERPVIAYCSAGVRSEILASLMGNRGFRDVHPLEGGIVGYGRAYADEGLWQGALYVAGDRVQITFSEHPEVLGRCETCGRPTDCYRDCVAPLCLGWALLCNGCADFALCGAHRN